MSARRTAALAPALAALLLIAGCGDPDLWARWRAERDLWRARHEADRILVRLSGARPADWDRAAGAFRGVIERFPASVWADPGKLERRRSRDVAKAAGQAAIALGKLEELRGRNAEALVVFERAESDWHGLPAIALEAAVGRSRLLDHAGRFADAERVWQHIADSIPLIDPDADRIQTAAIDAPLRLAREQHASGRDAQADSTLARSEARIVEALAHAGAHVAPDLWRALATVRASRGHTDASLDAVRGALPFARDPATTQSLVLLLATYSLDAGRPESTRVYSRWALGVRGPSRRQPLLLIAEAWEQQGATDSALTAYGHLLDLYPEAANVGAVARFQRAGLYDKLGQWPLARTEYRSLVASNPTHELSFLSLQRIVQHHLGLGETDLARTEGRRAVESLDHLLESNRDESVQKQSRQVRAEILESIGATVAAESALVDVWRRWPSDSSAQAGALRAALLAAQDPESRPFAQRVMQQLAQRAGNGAVRQAAADAVAGRKGTP